MVGAITRRLTASPAEEAFVRTIAVVVAALAALSLASTHARADGAWCSYYVQGGTNCGFYSYEQCRANISGIGGSCLPNPGYADPAGSAGRRRRNY